ncbi:hypothetical protein FOZ60_013933 [Perkinsus olseni]|uniref:Uncharacterized protein n=1 Tax=Perkinsus olseni TaxID=32597 RepID=A0A7J6P837_PEROL|nr:hypothetical protein FOZ60_013933 [Perkinsus olseni]
MSVDLPNSESPPLAVVTGATAGIGLEVCKKLLESGWKVVVGARDVAKAEKAFGSSRVQQKFSRIDRLVLNGGVMQRNASLTKDKLDEIWQVNFFSNVLLMTLLLPTLKKSKDSAVIVTNSSAHQWGREADTLERITNCESQGSSYIYPSYCSSKLAMLAFGSEFSKRTHCRVVQCHPGVVKTDLFTQQPWFIRLSVNFAGLSAKEGALPIYAACVDPEAQGLSCTTVGCQQSSKTSRDPQFWSKVWQKTCEVMPNHVSKETWEEALKNIETHADGL